MSENQNPPEGTDEITVLREMATKMGIQFHPNTGLKKLKEMVAAKQNGETIHPDELETIKDGLAAEAVETHTPMKKQTPAQAKAERRKKALQLVRVRVTNMNPLKGNVPGEIFGAGNSELGFVKKYIPYNADQGYHIPRILLDELRNRRYSAFYETKDGKGRKHKNRRLVPELAIEVMPPLTPKELEALRQRQLMAAGKESE